MTITDAIDRINDLIKQNPYIRINFVRLYKRKPPLKDYLKVILWVELDGYNSIDIAQKLSGKETLEQQIRKIVNEIHIALIFDIYNTH